MAPEGLVAGVIVLSLAVYALTGGADFGAGVWDLLATGPRTKRQREVIAAAIAPIWEVNHIWLILVVVLLFVGFPAAFAAIVTALHLPLMIMLFGVVLRGSAFVFRASAPPDDTTQRRLGAMFAAGSIVAPWMLGACLGAVVAGRLPLDAEGRVVTDFVSAWWAPFPMAVGGFVLALFAWLAAVYLVRETQDEPLRQDFRTRALAAGTVAGAFALLSLGLARTGAPLLWGTIAAGPFQGLTAAVAVGALAATWSRRDVLARALVAATVLLVVAGWAVAQHPWLLPPDLPIAGSGAPPEVLWPLLGTLGAGGMLLVPAMVWLLRVFKGTEAAPPT